MLLPSFSAVTRSRIPSPLTSPVAIADSEAQVAMDWVNAEASRWLLEQHGHAATARECNVGASVD
jgi:hypothetical protein